MTVRAAVALGIRKVNRTKRMVMFAWIINVLVTLVVAGPMLRLLDASIRTTVMEEKLLEDIDLNWLDTFKADHPRNPIVRMLGLSIFGAAPFLDHLDGLITGEVVTSVGRFLGSLLFEFRVNTEAFDIALVLVLLYILLWTYLSGGFVGMYAREHRSSFAEFLQMGARFFGKFFRLALMQLVVYFVVFLGVGWLSTNIRAWTASEPSEMTAFIYYMIRNVGVLLVVGLITLCFDYAKIRMVVDSRVSALGGLGAGVRFVLTHPLRTASLAVFLAALGVALAGVFVLLEGQIRQSAFWTIAAVFIFQQLYVWSRQWLRAAYYATQTALYRAHAGETTLEEPRPDLAAASHNG